jgi:hypothetical protein
VYHCVVFNSTFALQNKNTMLVLFGDKVSIEVTRDFKQLVNISIAAGKFILIHPQYDLIREAMRLELFEDERLEEFEVHNWQFEVGEIITYDFDEMIFFYSLLELNCRIFLCEIGDDLKRMAIESGEVDEQEFYRLRGIHLNQAEDLLHQINHAFSSNERFNAVHSRIEQLNALA